MPNFLQAVEHIAGLLWKVLGVVFVVTFANDLAPLFAGTDAANVTVLSYWLGGLTGALHAAEAAAAKALARYLAVQPMMPSSSPDNTYTAMDVLRIDNAPAELEAAAIEVLKGVLIPQRE